MISAKHDYRGFYVATVDGHETTIFGEDKTRVEATAKDLIDLVKQQIADTEHDHTLSFYACGDDREAQRRFAQQFIDVTVV